VEGREGGGILNSAIITIGKGLTVTLDERDIPLVQGFRWHRSGGSPCYAATFAVIDGRKVTLYMHRLIMNAKQGQEVDHINRDPLDNRRANLRIVTKSENQQNQPARRPKSASGWRNVCWRPERRRYDVRITVDGRRLTYGSYTSLEEAVEAAKIARASVMPASPEARGEFS
jgi:hypothetical protein